MKFLLHALLLALTGFANAETRPVIATTNYPLTYFTTRLAGDFATILYQVPADQDPAFWKPGDAEIEKIQKADLIVLNEATYEKWAITAALPYDRIVDTSIEFADQFIETEDGKMHSHGGSAPHSHGGTAFTTWLDFNQALLQATAIKDALVAVYPDQAGGVKTAFAKLKTDLQNLDAGMKAAAAPLKGTTVLASHPIYQYLARAYGVEIKALVWEPETVLDEAALADLDQLRSDHPAAKLFIWEGAPPPESIALLKQRDLVSIIFTPCFSTPPTGDFLSVMKDNIARLETGLTGG